MNMRAAWMAALMTAALWAQAAAPLVVTFPIYNFGVSPATNRSVVITPIILTPGTGQVAVYDRVSYLTGTNGSFSVTNMMVGVYRVAVQSPPDRTSFAIAVTTNDMGAVSADTMLVAMPTVVTRPQDYPYSAQASDARYAVAGGGGLAFIPQVGSENLTNWAALTAADYSNTLAGAWAAADLIVGTDATNYTYATSNLLYGFIQSAAGSNGVVSFNTRTGLVTLTSNDVVTALGYAPGTGSGSGITNGQADINFVNLSLTNGGDSAAILVVAQDGPDQVWKWTPNELLAFHGVDRMLNISSAGNIDMLGDLTARHLFGEYAGNGTNLTNLNASALASGTVPLARLSGITSNQFDAGTSNLLALAGTGSAFTTNLSGLWVNDLVVSNTATFSNLTIGTLTLSNAMIGSNVLEAASLTTNLVDAQFYELLGAGGTPRTTNTAVLINVKDYGATGTNNVALDSAGIRAAYAAWTNTGGVLYFPNGSYIDTNVYWMNYTFPPGARPSHPWTIAGDGVGVSVWNAKLTNATFLTFNGVLPDVRDIALVDLGSGTNNGIFITNNTRQAFWYNIVVKSFKGTGANLNGACGGLVHGSFANNGVGLKLPGYCDGWQGHLRLDSNLIGLQVGGYAPGFDTNRASANGTRWQVVGANNDIGVLIVGQSRGTTIGGYFENNRNCNVHIGYPAGYSEGLGGGSADFVGPIEVCGMDGRLTNSGAYSYNWSPGVVVATNCIGLTLRNIGGFFGAPDVYLANSAANNTPIILENCRWGTIGYADGKLYGSAAYGPGYGVTYKNANMLWQSKTSTNVVAYMSNGVFMATSLAGDGAGITALNASELSTGTLPLARLAGTGGLTTNYTLNTGEIMRITNGLVVSITLPEPYLWNVIASNYLVRIGQAVAETNALATNVNDFVKAAVGTLTNLDAFYLFCTSAESNTLNLLGETYPLTYTGNITSDATGIQGDSAPGTWVDTGWTNPAIASGTLWLFRTTSGSVPTNNYNGWFGARDVSTSSGNCSGLYMVKAYNERGYYFVNRSVYEGPYFVVTNSSPGSLCVTRTATNYTAVYTNAGLTAHASDVTLTNGIPTNTVHLLHVNVGAQAPTWSGWNGKVQAFGMGSNGISAAQSAALYQAVTNFNARVGR